MIWVNKEIIAVFIKKVIDKTIEDDTGKCVSQIDWRIFIIKKLWTVIEIVIMILLNTLITYISVSSMKNKSP